MEHDPVYGRLLRMLTDDFGLRSEDMKLTMEELGLSDADIAYIITQLESEFDIEFTDAEVGNPWTLSFRVIGRIVRRKLVQHNTLPQDGSLDP